MIRSYPGGAIEVTLTAPINAVDMVMSVSALTGYPDGTDGPFSVVLRKGEPEEEKLLIATSGGGVMNIQQRGYDSTIPQSHPSGATVRACITSIDAQEANEHVNGTIGVHGLSGLDTIAGVTATQSFQNKTIDGDLNTVKDLKLALSPEIVAGFTAASAALTAHGTAEVTARNVAIAAEATARTTAQNAHAAATVTHGATGAIVGTTNVQSLSGKTLVLPTIADLTNAPHNHYNAAGGGFIKSHGVKGVRTANLNIPDGATTRVFFVDADEYDDGAIHDHAGVEPYLFTIQRTGRYDGLANMIWQGNATGRRAIDIRLNDASSDGTGGSSIGRVNQEPGFAQLFYQQCAFRKQLTAGDTLKVFVTQNSGGTIQLDPIAGEGDLYLALDWLGT